MKAFYKMFLMLIGASLLAACGDSSTPQSRLVLPPSASVQVLHASVDAPRVNILVDGAAVLSDVDFKSGSAFLTLDEGTYDIAVEAIIPGGNAVVIDLPGTQLDRDTEYSVLAVGKVATATLDALVVANPVSAVSAGSARVQVVHAAADVIPVDVYATAPGANLANEAPLGSFAFGETLGPVEVPAGDYQIRVTPVNTPGTVVFDAGVVTLDDGVNLLLSAVNRTGAGTAPISLVVQDSINPPFEIRDVATPANLRVVHASPDAPTVDVIVNDNFAAPLVPALSFPEFTPYVSPDAGTYNVKVVDSATQGVIALTFSATLDAGGEYTVLATDFLASIQELVLIDDNRRVATEAKVRIVHGSPSAGPVDIYVEAPGTDITQSTPAFSDVEIRQSTGYVSLAPGDYEVSVTPANDPTTVAIFAPLTLASEGVYTAIARDAEGGAGGFPLDLIGLDDLSP